MHLCGFIKRQGLAGRVGGDNVFYSAVAQSMAYDAQYAQKALLFSRLLTLCSQSLNRSPAHITATDRQHGQLQPEDTMMAQDWHYHWVASQQELFLQVLLE